MNQDDTSNGFSIWGIDQAAYGPVELPTLVSWIKDERVLADTWVYGQREQSWRRASDIPELQMFFRARSVSAPAGGGKPNGVRTGVLRRVKILGSLSEAQLERFAQFMEQLRLAQWSVVVRHGELGDSMYLILDGELRVRIMVNGKETILSTLGPGDFFGDISLFDQGPRSADVVANVDSTVLKMTAAGFEKLAKEAPEIATPFLLGTLRTLSARIRADNKRLGDNVKLSNAAGL